MATIQIQNDGLTEARKALERWAEWIQAVRGTNLNFPNHSNFVQVPAGVAEFSDPLAERVEGIMCRLSPEIAKALRLEYCTGLSLKAKAREMGVSEATYKNWRLYGEHYIAGALA